MACNSVPLFYDHYSYVHVIGTQDSGGAAKPRKVGMAGALDVAALRRPSVYGGGTDETWLSCAAYHTLVSFDEPNGVDESYAGQVVNLLTPHGLLFTCNHHLPLSPSLSACL